MCSQIENKQFNVFSPQDMFGSLIFWHKKKYKFLLELSFIRSRVIHSLCFIKLETIIVSFVSAVLQLFCFRNNKINEIKHDVRREKREIYFLKGQIENQFVPKLPILVLVHIFAVTILVEKPTTWEKFWLFKVKCFVQICWKKNVSILMSVLCTWYFAFLLTCICMETQINRYGTLNFAHSRQDQSTENNWSPHTLWHRCFLPECHLTTKKSTQMENVEMWDIEEKNNTKNGGEFVLTNTMIFDLLLRSLTLNYYFIFADVAWLSVKYRSSHNVSHVRCDNDI